MKRRQNLLLLVAVVLLSALPLWLVQKPAANADHPVEFFAGADNQARDLIGAIDPDFQPWFQPLMEPASGEIASLLFALQAALGAGVKRFVYASSSAVYGDDPLPTKQEDSLGRPLSPYAASKLINEVYARCHHAAYGLETVGFRFFNVFGPRQDP
ncbi:MAG: energy-coupling factor ABC transporter substrate-binding protein, partial [Phycisphaerae bacterium]|nr:energy-coupling factor ABC transporter substrate-binding protein [Phycisphaerae bacterium]